MVKKELCLTWPKIIKEKLKLYQKAFISRKIILVQT